MEQIQPEADIENHPVVSSADWLEARRQLLAKEKEFTRIRDELTCQRQELPWELVAKKYEFDGPMGTETLADLFNGRSQLIVYHFMFAPEWKEGCAHCSFWADSWNGVTVHLAQRDTTMVAISRAQLSKLEEFKRRMGWSFKWLSSYSSDFNYDFHASWREADLKRGKVLHNYRELEMSRTDLTGISVFFRNRAGQIFHTYSCYSRGVDMMNAAYQYLDLTPKGRDEKELKVQFKTPQAWVRHHDKYTD